MKRKNDSTKEWKTEGYTGEWEFLGETNLLTIWTAEYIVTYQARRDQGHKKCYSMYMKMNVFNLETENLELRLVL